MPVIGSENIRLQGSWKPQVQPFQGRLVEGIRISFRHERTTIKVMYNLCVQFFISFFVLRINLNVVNKQECTTINLHQETEQCFNFFYR